VDSPINVTYQQGFVALSYVFAVIGSFVALTSARGIVRPSGRVSYSIVAVTGVALGGVGVWSMHFVGMLAAKLQIGVGYSMLETLVSLAAAIVASSLALLYVAKHPNQFARILIAGTLLGLGVALMHYLGMFGMRFGGFIRWSVPMVAASLAIAVAAASIALWLAFHTIGIGARVAAALVMGMAVCAMHYTGMSAADFICTTEDRLAVPSGSGVIPSFAMPMWVVMITIGAIFLITLDWLLRTEHAKTEAIVAAIRR